MSFCAHCAGQRSPDEAMALVIRAVRSLEIPHLELLEEMGDDTVIH